MMEMFSDIQHRVFRLGKLGGLKGDSYRAFADEVGDTCRDQREKMIRDFIHMGFFRDDPLNLSHPVVMNERGKKSLGAIHDEVFIDWDGSVDCVKMGNKNPDEIRPAFMMNFDYLVFTF